MQPHYHWPRDPERRAVCVTSDHLELSWEIEVRCKLWKINGKLGWLLRGLCRRKGSEILFRTCRYLVDEIAEWLLNVAKVLRLKVHVLISSFMHHNLYVSDKPYVTNSTVLTSLRAPTLTFRASRDHSLMQGPRSIPSITTGFEMSTIRLKPFASSRCILGVTDIAVSVRLRGMDFIRAALRSCSLRTSELGFWLSSQLHLKCGLCFPIWRV